MATASQRCEVFWDPCREVGSGSKPDYRPLMPLWLLQVATRTPLTRMPR
jgi:hypothetical protein